MAQPGSPNLNGNVAGSIIIGDNQFFAHTSHGALIRKQVAPQVRLRPGLPESPQALPGFVNRATELVRLETWINFNEVVLLHAPDGLGKTALLKQAANSEAARAMPNGVVWLESPGFAGLTLGADDVFQLMFEALFEAQPRLKVDSSTARTHLSATRPLVILDEVPLPPMLQRALSDFIPEGAFLLAADLPLGGEYQRLALGPLPRDEAVHLLSEHSGIAPDETLKFICGVLEDLSLAIVVTGKLMRASGLSPAETLTSLGAHQLGGMDPIAIALDRAYLLAFSRLNEAERKILSVAAITPGVSMSPEWLNFALGAKVEAHFNHLVALGLLTLEGTRLRLPTGFRLTARRRSVLDEQAVYPRLIEYLLKQPQPDEDFFRAELGNFLGAIDWAARAGRSTNVIELGRALDPYLMQHGLWDLWGGVLDAILNAAVREGDRVTEAWALHQLGARLIGLGNISQAVELLKHALKLRQKQGDQPGAAFTQHNLDLLFPLTRPVERSQRLPANPKLLLGLGLAAALLLIVLFFFLR